MAASQDVASSPDGRGDAIELLNVLQITDVYQLPALIYPTRTFIVGKVPETYDWSMQTLGKLDVNDCVIAVNDIKEF